MSKRRRANAGAPIADVPTRPAHNYDDAHKQMCVALMKSEVISQMELSKVPGAPSRTTLYQWLGDDKKPLVRFHITATPGRPPLLSDEELSIVGGYVVFCAEHHQTCGGNEIIHFICNVFDVEVDKTWVARHMKLLGISSHRPASLKYTFGGTRSVSAAYDFLTANQKVLKGIEPRSRVVAIDQISFWDCGVSSSTYSPIGAGQPRLWDSDPGEKHIVYEAFTADGSCLPPVIFTTRPTEASKEADGLFYDEQDNAAYVVYIPNLGGPSEASTAAWLDKMTSPKKNYFADHPHVILDSLRGHFTPTMLGDWDNVHATLYQLPAASGKWLNPCDQSINREMRREFVRLQQLDCRDKIRNIIRAYYSIKEDTIMKSFKKCGIFEGDPDEIISAQASQGYYAVGNRGDVLEGYRVSFEAWAHMNTREPTDMLPRTAPPTALDERLDGVYWTAHGTSFARRA